MQKKHKQSSCCTAAEISRCRRSEPVKRGKKQKGTDGWSHSVLCPRKNKQMQTTAGTGWSSRTQSLEPNDRVIRWAERKINSALFPLVPHQGLELQLKPFKMSTNAPELCYRPSYLLLTNECSLSGFTYLLDPLEKVLLPYPIPLDTEGAIWQVRNLKVA